MSDVKIWLNGMKCVSPTDEFAAEVGRDIIEMLMRDGQPKTEPLDPFRKITIEVSCS